MPSKRHKKSADLFRAACELAPDARAAFLEEACAGDTKLRAEVEALLEQDQEHPSFLEAPATLKNPSKPGHTTRTGKPPAGAARGRAALPEQIGPYRILEKIGEGGMGVVYVAEQREPVRRKVALKVIKLGMDTKQVLARFEVEHHALTIMNHPNIARVYDAGATPEGRPYFVMEHVPGIPINDYCDRHLLNTRQRLELFIPVCNAVQHAHQKNVIHRDLKPSNVLVMMQDGKPVPKIIDFGVAKATGQRLTERTLHTEIGQVIGTPEYMSPEQAEMTAIDIDTRTDIYSLGVILYELLVGAMPFDPKSLRQAGYAEIQRIIREVDPPRPSTRLSSLGDESTTVAQKRHTDRTSLERQLRGDLDWITMKAIEKDRTRRYETANGLALDVRRHLNHEPVLASRPSAAYKVSKFVRRNRALVGGLAAVFVVLVAGVTVSTTQYLKADAARQEAEAARTQATQRATELEQIAKFQEEQLTAIDVPLMAVRLRKSVLEKARAAAERAGPEEAAACRAQLEKLLADLDFTGVALNLLDENIFERTVNDINEQFETQPLIRARLLQALADTSGRLGMEKRATEPQKTALEIRRRVLGNDHPDTLRSISSMGDLLWQLGKFADAETSFREAIEAQRRVLGDDHPDTLTSINSMGVLLMDLNRKAESELYIREALQGRRRVLGNDHPDTLVSITNMAVVFYGQGRRDESMPYIREALEGCRRVLGDDHPNTLASIKRMAEVLFYTGKLDEAEEYFREALEGHRRLLGDDHQETLFSSYDMGLLLNRLGRYDEAAELLLGGEATARRVWSGDNARWLGIYLEVLGGARTGLRQFAEAERTLVESYELLSAGFGMSWRTTRLIERFIALYDAWNAAEPGKGYDAKAAEWRAKLPDTDPDSPSP